MQKNNNIMIKKYSIITFHKIYLIYLIYDLTKKIKLTSNLLITSIVKNNFKICLIK